MDNNHNIQVNEHKVKAGSQVNKMTVTALNMTWLVRSVTRSLMLQSGKRMKKYANQQNDGMFDDEMDPIDLLTHDGFEQKGMY